MIHQLPPGRNFNLSDPFILRDKKNGTSCKYPTPLTKTQLSEGDRIIFILVKFKIKYPSQQEEQRCEQCPTTSQQFPRMTAEARFGSKNAYHRQAISPRTIKKWVAYPSA